MGVFCLLLTSVIWGAAFLAQKLGMDDTGPFAFTVYRNVLAALCVFLVRPRRPNVATWKAGLWSGVALWIAMMLQQIGILGTSPGICAFLTTNYVLAVPIIALVCPTALRLLRRGAADAFPPPARYVWPGAGVAALGTFLICVSGGEGFAVGAGELLSLACAFAFGAQIVVVDRQVAKSEVDVLGMCWIQFLVGAVLGLPFLLLPSERALMTIAHLKAGAGAIAFCGILSSGVAYTLQNVGQKRVKPGIAAILMSLESVFATLFAWLFLGETLTSRQFCGCGLVFLSVVYVNVRDALSGR